MHSGAVGLGQQVLGEDSLGVTRSAAGLVEAAHFLGEVAHEVKIVRDKDHRERGGAVDFLQDIAEVVAATPIHARGGFVQEEKLWLLKESGGDQNPLKLPAGKGSQPLPEQVGNMQTLERVGDFPFLFSTYSAAPEKPRRMVDGEKFPHGDGK